MTSPPQEKLVRAIGRWGLTGLMINTIIGGGIFGLPGIIGKRLGAASPWAYLVAAAGMAVIVACFAEVASQFRETGGPYLYARAAFGRFWGIQMGWLQWLVRMASTASVASLFVVFLAELWPGASRPRERALVIALLIGLHAAINLLGVRSGANMSSFFAVTKLLPLGALIAAGLYFLAGPHPAVVPAPAATQWKAWLDAIVLLVYAYAGFEGVLAPMGEAKDPQHDAPFALFVCLLVCTVVYTLIQVVVLWTVSPAAMGERSIAEAARNIAGPPGALFLAVGALLSTFGYVGAQLLNGPRFTYALAEQGDFPAVFAAVHVRFRTPYVSIAVFGAASYALALAGNFEWNAVLAAIARLIGFVLVCAAVPVLRGKTPATPAFRLPAGRVLSVVGILFSLVLVSRVGRNELFILLATFAVAGVNWLWARNRATPSQEQANLS